MAEKDDDDPEDRGEERNASCGRYGVGSPKSTPGGDRLALERVGSLGSLDQIKGSCGSREGGEGAQGGAPVSASRTRGPLGHGGEQSEANWTTHKTHSVPVGLVAETVKAVLTLEVREDGNNHDRGRFRYTDGAEPEPELV